VVTSAGRPQVGRGTGTATTCGRVLEHAQLAPNVSMADAIEQARTDLDAEGVPRRCHEDGVRLRGTVSAGVRNLAICR
jgi:hypothetical protein